MVNYFDAEIDGNKNHLGRGPKIKRHFASRKEFDLSLLRTKKLNDDFALLSRRKRKRGGHLVCSGASNKNIPKQAKPFSLARPKIEEIDLSTSK